MTDGALLRTLEGPIIFGKKIFDLNGSSGDSSDD